MGKIKKYIKYITFGIFIGLLIIYLNFKRVDVKDELQGSNLRLGSIYRLTKE